MTFTIHVPSNPVHAPPPVKRPLRALRVLRAFVSSWCFPPHSTASILSPAPAPTAKRPFVPLWTVVPRAAGPLSSMGAQLPSLRIPPLVAELPLCVHLRSSAVPPSVSFVFFVFFSSASSAFSAVPSSVSFVPLCLRGFFHSSTRPPGPFSKPATPPLSSLCHVPYYQNLHLQKAQKGPLFRPPRLFIICALPLFLPAVAAGAQPETIAREA